MVGNFGDAEVFSFHATKFFNSFEGGAVTTNDDELANKIRLMKNFGFSGYDEVTFIGTNGKMSECSAAMGLTSLDSLDDFIKTNHENYQQYRDGLGVPEIRLMTFDEKEKCNYQYIVMELDEAGAGIGRDELVEILHAENVIARRYFYPGCHRMEPYRSNYPDAGLKLPLTERLVQRVITLPTGTGVSTRQISEICELIKLVVSHGPEVHERRSRLPL
jgi:dTDP-4-amino-4,6-dideoxygalactose transaminase